MNSLKTYTIENYAFSYDKNLDNEFKNLGYHDRDLKRLGKNLVAYLKNTPPKLKGDVIKESGGAVKVRVSKNSSNRSNEDRLIYALLFGKFFIFIRIYTKSRKKDLSKKEIKEINELISQYKESLASTTGKIIGGAGAVAGVGAVVMGKDRHKLGDGDILASFEFIDETIMLD